MKGSVFIASLAALPAFVSAHPNPVPGVPTLWGRRAVKNVDSREGFKLHPQSSEKNAIDKRAANTYAGSAQSEKRQSGNTDGQCGGEFGACADGYCCSGAGWCGNTEEYCAAPGCQFNWGSGCDTLVVPGGPKTSDVERTHVGSIPYGGEGIYACTVPGTFALTFDDGPYHFTGDVLDILDRYNVKATFFMTGNSISKGPIDQAGLPWASIIQRMHSSGHQIASHTWGHQALGSGAAAQGQDPLTTEQRLAQMYNNEIAFNNILGFFPTYMRPPYSDCDDASGCAATMSDLGYHVIYFDFDTEGYLHTTPETIGESKAIFDQQLPQRSPADGAWLNIEHDIHEQVAHTLTEHIIKGAVEAGWKLVTVGECLGDPQENWYRTLGAGST
ncbi:glycoside hydrolase/deacetylase [Eremomyces bilateralis CBS 781.70]|uniref:Glycoside hydrolase/deacetylase n=1 Tax=Eremomyces bilateralis CBS 781.70 TaxID=1392243 RepID=A0A6G1GDR5_9PEZI|nr:glycoside hydrolase/deacetylase [Eremomyces bilateralis CBS 781.70]KAF1816046.1 glycoside hydrolase/deacetylase [Eremomyces bilateralis CBS 781.70]